MKGRMLVAVMAIWGAAAYADDYSTDDTPSDMPTGNTYLGVEALQNSVKSSDVNTGFGGAVQAGVHLSPRLSMETDLRYREDDYHVYSGMSTRKSVNGVLRYELSDNDLWRPYIAIGGGIVKAKQFYDYGTDPEGTIALGLLYNIDPRWQVRAEVTYLKVFRGRDDNEDMVTIGGQYNFDLWLPRPGR